MATTAVSKKRFMAVEKKASSASKRAYGYKRELDKQNTVLGATLAPATGAFVAGALEGMLAPDGELIPGIPASLGMGLVGLGAGALMKNSFLLRAAQGPLSHYIYEMGITTTLSASE